MPATRVAWLSSARSPHGEAARSASAGSPVAGALYFVLFYAGTLPFFLPLLGVPFFSPKVPTFRRIARMTQILVGGYFFLITGLVQILFGVR